MKKTGHTKVQLGEIATVFSGFAFKSSDLGSSGIPVIKIGNIQAGCVQSRCADHFPRELFTGKLDRYVLQQGDSLVAMTGAGSVGKFGRMLKVSQRFLVNQRVGIIRPDKAKCDPAFVFYVLSLPNYEKTLYAQGLGAGQPNVSAKQISDLELPFPPLKTQRCIASILSAYDDLIENNTRRIAILEEMARRIYEEWFVRFRFPGHEQVKMVEPELGLIPEGWSYQPLGVLAEVQWGDTTKTKKAYVKDGFTAYSASGPDGKLSYFDFDREGIVLSAIGNVGLTWFARGKWSCIKNTIKFWARSEQGVSNSFLYFATKSPDFWPKRGAAQPFISLGDARACKVLTPAETLVHKFDHTVAPMFKLVDSLSNKNTNLRTTRDLLLPKLISGELDVSNLPEPEEAIAA
ncbi:restriction endonuclease subunit S [Propionivibrio dicarboxylicus]|uniref:Type I restriction enzyme, S subunit n=1 Tax=Propionivibrio dicarboxylicus TaxID=83767 RepID=A0A1G8JM80_9RHOO|nr:restriction endonuclease subunit S [Propionivibrio dicarboxylicus]SDI31750.1 type I restriction enzyme, S subunit [Propionivibrio dicarboxylicus]